MLVAVRRDLIAGERVAGGAVHAHNAPDRGLNGGGP
jgi:hypothetical protein